MRPFQLPYLYQRVLFLFLRTHPLEVRWSWNCGAVVIPVVFSDPWTPSLRISPILRPVTSVVPIGDTREENTADKEIGPAGPQTIPSPCSTVCGQRGFPSRRRSWRLTAASNWSRGRNKSSNIQPYPSGTVCGQRKLAPYAARTWRPTRGSKSPKGQRKDSGLTAVRLPSDKSPNDIPKPPSTARSAMTFLSRCMFLRQKKV